MVVAAVAVVVAAAPAGDPAWASAQLRLANCNQQPPGASFSTITLRWSCCTKELAYTRASSRQVKRGPHTSRLCT